MGPLSGALALGAEEITTGWGSAVWPADIPGSFMHGPHPIVPSSDTAKGREVTQMQSCHKGVFPREWSQARSSKAACGILESISWQKCLSLATNLEQILRTEQAAVDSQSALSCILDYLSAQNRGLLADADLLLHCTMGYALRISSSGPVLVYDISYKE